MDAERFQPLLDDDDFPTRSSQWDWASPRPPIDNADCTDATTEGGQRTEEGEENVLPTTVILIRRMRIGNVASAALFIFGSVANLVHAFSLPKMVLASYGIFFGLLVFSLESNLSILRKPIASNFGFMYDPILRLMFSLLMGMVAWSFDTLLGYLSAGALSFTAGWTTFVLCMHPNHGRALREISDEEERRLKEEGVRLLLSHGNDAPWWEV